MGLQVKEILTVAENILVDAGDADYKTDAGILLCHVLRYDEQKLFMNWMRELEDSYSETYFALIRRRAEGEPTQYVTGKAPFMGMEFKVDSRVLIPRDDTETL
ncbi:MAG: peptide chain release factor N(5)-glutamine methyltransferase, partial [Clostridiales Family XIII bacterium]|nr:peptide chain release factor N(5)-glutamine methyltransferase [Clostridiales Family XIII bacterium]